MSTALRAYVLLQFALLLGMVTHFLDLASHAGWLLLLAYAAWQVVGLCVLGALMEGRRWAWWGEGLRTLAMAVLPLGTQHWFGVARLDDRIVLGFALVFGASALALPWLHAGARVARRSMARA